MAEQQQEVKKKVVKKRTIKAEPEGYVHIQASFNNIIITFATKAGQTISWSSAGKVGFRGSKKNTPYAAQMAAQEAGKVAHDSGLRKVEVFVKGPGAGREAAIRAINTIGIDVTIIHDITPIPHNGCRPPKKRRV
jgi:small subunit ribosomal protein S11